jgi:hypothetical protein
MSNLSRSAAALFADALYMKIALPSIGNGIPAEGEKTMTLYIPGGPKIPFSLKIIGEFSGFLAKAESAILLRGPGDLLFLLGRSYTDQAAAKRSSPEKSKQYEICVAAVIDGRETPAAKILEIFAKHERTLDEVLNFCHTRGVFQRIGENPEWTRR